MCAAGCQFLHAAVRAFERIVRARSSPARANRRHAAPGLQPSPRAGSNIRSRPHSLHIDGKEDGDSGAQDIDGLAGGKSREPGLDDGPGGHGLLRSLRPRVDRLSMAFGAPRSGDQAMSTSTPVNRRILFARWPVGAPLPEDFKTVNEPLPTANLGQVLLRTLYLSLDLYLPCRMTPGPSYVEPMALC